VEDNIPCKSCQKNFDFLPRQCKANLANHDKARGKKYQT
jgi:hypothetical protein